MAKKILIADDDQEANEILSMLLEENGYGVITAYDAMQAVNRAVREKPDLIILDIRMPAGGGISVYQKIRNNNLIKTTQVIVITGYKDANVEENLINMGVQDFVVKPYDPPKLLEKIKALIG